MTDTSSSQVATSNLCVHVQNLAGAVHFIDRLAADATVAELKRRLHAIDADCIVSKTRLMLMHDHLSADDDVATHTVLADGTRTLASYGVVENTTLHSLVEMNTPGEFVRTIGVLRTSGADNCHFNSPYGVCVSPDGALLLVADHDNNRVQVVRASDGEHVRTIGGVVGGGGGNADDGLAGPIGVCWSPDASLIIVGDCDNHRVQVFCAAQGTLVRSIGRSGTGDGEFRDPEGVCCSPDGQLLYVADYMLHRVQVFRIADGSHVRTIGQKGKGDGSFEHARFVCMSPDGAHLYVSDLDNHRVQMLYAADGSYAHVRSIGRRGDRDGELSGPRGIALSSDGELLFVAHFGHDRVEVFHTADGSFAYGFRCQASAPFDVSVSASTGEVFVAAKSGHCIQVFHS